MFGSSRPRLLAAWLPTVIFLLSAFPVLAQGSGSGPALTLDEVTCNGQRIEGLVQLVSVGGDQTRNGFLIPVSPELWSILVVENQWNRRYADLPEPLVPELHLAAVLTTEVRPYLLNPGRPELEQVALSRIDSATTFTTLERLRLTIDPTIEGSFASTLQVGNRRSSLAGGARPGRALRANGVVGTCEAPEVAEVDRNTMELLSRLLRFRQEFVFPFDGGEGDTLIGIYRDLDPDSYRIDLYGHDVFEWIGPSSLRLEVTRDDQTGALVSGLLSPADPLFQPRFGGFHFEELFVRPPVLPGVEFWPLDGPETVHLLRDEETIFEPFDPIPLDFQELLDDTVWNP